MAKDVEIKARVATQMRDEMQALADEKGESISVILREAIREYLDRKKAAALLLSDVPANYRTGKSPPVELPSKARGRRAAGS